MFRLNFNPSKEQSNMKKCNIIFLLIPLITTCGVNSFSASDRNDTQTLSAPKAFDPKRTEYTCATWTPPSDTDAEAEQFAGGEGRVALEVAVKRALCKSYRIW